jgi:hypothetical protein
MKDMNNKLVAAVLSVVYMFESSVEDSSRK